MQTQLEYPVVTDLIDVIADWWRQRDRRRSGLAAVPGSEVERMARDIGVTAAELRALDRRGDQPLLLTRMAAALQIDLQLVARREPDTLRDLERVCALCDSKKRCAGDLAGGDAAATYEAYCPNALTLKLLN